MARPTRYLSSRDRSSFTPVHAVWEITLACDLKCQHCGSRAGKRRPDELTTAECLDLVRQLARMGTREITLIGGEAYLRRDWLEIIREIRAQGMDCTMQSGVSILPTSVSRPPQMRVCKRSASRSTACATSTID